MQVSVPGIYQNPAPYREQTFTYSTALAFTGRSAACAPPMATRAAAEPRTRLLTIFMFNLQVVFREGVDLSSPSKSASPAPRETAQPLRAFGHTRENARDLSEPPATGRSRTPHRRDGLCMRHFSYQNSLLDHQSV